MDIQLFSEPENVEAVETVEENKADEVDGKIEAALKKAREEWETALKKRDEQALKTARLSQLSEEERVKEELEGTRLELEAQKAEFEREKIKYEAMKVMAQRKLPTEFAEYLIDADNEGTLAKITAFEKKYKKAVEDGVNEKLKGRAPATGSKSEVPSKASFMKAIYESQINV